MSRIFTFQRILHRKVEEWAELLAKLQSGETYVEVNLARWWSECVDHSQPGTAECSYSITPALRLKMTQQPEVVLEEIVDQIKEVEARSIPFTTHLPGIWFEFLRSFE